MLVSFQHTCPHCETQKIAFVITVDWPVPTASKDRYFAARCAHCSGGIIGHIHHSSSSTYDLSKMYGDVKNNQLTVLRTWPKNVESKIPEHIPENIGNFYKQAIAAIKSRSWDAAGMMFRKVLETATKDLSADGNKATLAKRIEQMQVSGLLTRDLADWAHEIRIEGNGAAHDESPFSLEDAEALNDFCEHFLIYTYTLPKRIALRRHTEATD